MPEALPPDAHSLHDDLPARPRPPRYWLYALIAVFIFVCVVLVALLNFYASMQQLDRDKLYAARMRWRDSGIQDYNLDIAVNGSTKNDYHIEVRGGKHTDACTVDGKPFDPPEKARFWTVETLLDEVLKKELDLNQNDRTCHSEVDFDEALGYPKRYLKTSNDRVTGFIVRLQTKNLNQKLPAFGLGGGGVQGQSTRVRAPSGSASGSSSSGGASGSRASSSLPAGSAPVSPR